jgi:peptidoglycan hydrolase CwlO-like protein
MNRSVYSALSNPNLLPVNASNNVAHTPLLQSAHANTLALESQVKDVLSSAKSKLTDLNREIDKLSKENDSLQRQLDYATQHRGELVERNRQLNQNVR